MAKGRAQNNAAIRGALTDQGAIPLGTYETNGQPMATDSPVQTSACYQSRDSSLRTRSQRIDCLRSTSQRIVVHFGLDIFVCSHETHMLEGDGSMR